MRIYLDEQEKQLESVLCNACGRRLSVENGIVLEGCFQGDMAFGYFSSRDGRRHRFDLCEQCYNKMIAAYRIPVTDEEVTELL